ncbi:conserved oligomeric Golgi complex subunit 2 [Oratosquilla oratoria]|uniref:conserved oligomeric Golgi complex subunit 2 n=1 Tax=Oratosquilla oratoria TaxID=337810 RepID=UPI003F75B62C
MSFDCTLPMQLHGTSSLCFDKEEFMKNGFSVDTFVGIHQAAGSGGLETLRDDLGVYLKILRSAMIELINRDYADFVNLSTNLTGLDRLIEALKTPLGQLREEVLSVEKLLDEAIESTSADLERRQAITREKAMLHRLTQISNRLERMEVLLKSGGKGVTSIDGEELIETEGEGNLVDRLAAEVNHLNFLVNHCEGAELLEVFKPRVDHVCRFVERGLERGLREGVINKDLKILRQTLQTYASLGSMDHAHILVRQLIGQELEEVISDGALRSNPRGLPGMYSAVMMTVTKICQPLLKVTTGKGPDIVHGYCFLEKSAWPEIVSALELRTPHIFNPGNPAVFHQRFYESMEFLDGFEKLLKVQHKVKEFRKLPDYQVFTERWNLPVYFQIRYQEIGQVVECSLCKESGISLPLAPKEADYKLLATQTVWESLTRCYAAEVFLPPLLHRFWKLSLLILSRYRSWVVGVTEKFQKNSSLTVKEGAPGASPVKVGEPQGVQNERGNKSSTEITQSAVHLVHDVIKLGRNLTQLHTSHISSWVLHQPKDKQDLIIDILKKEGKKLEQLVGGLSKIIISSLKTESCAPLRQVADTPRLYRRTNRAPPSAHQPYISSSINTIATFINTNGMNVDQAMLHLWLSQIFSSLSEQYRIVTYDVLSSVQKMEESLKRLKRARDRSGQAGAETTGQLTDDDKIRMQICLDVEYLGQQMKEMNVDTSKIDSYTALLSMAQNAKAGNFTL